MDELEGESQQRGESDADALLEKIGAWSEVKHDVIEKYAAAYSRILSSRQNPSFSHVYVDAFAGAGRYLSRTTGIAVPGSAERALRVVPPFRELIFIDVDSLKVDRLERLAGDRTDVTVLHGNCNQVLVDQVLPRVRYDQYRRGLCILDPYGLHLEWKTVAEVASANSLEVFLNFPTMDINRNVLRRDPTEIAPVQAQRMTAFWGDESWRDFYRPSSQIDLWGEQAERKHASNEEVAEAYRDRLQRVAGFQFVPRPLPMRNSTNAVVYYLFFASHQSLAADIIEQVFSKHR